MTNSRPAATPRTVEVVRAELEDAWKRSDFAAVMRLSPEYARLENYQPTEADRRLGRRMGV